MEKGNSMLVNDIELAEKVIKGCNENDFSQIYLFTNENIKACFDKINFKSKDVLSVLASSDQVFDMFLRGAKTIDTFDINPLTKYYFHLKKAGIQALSQEDFITFFDIYNLVLDEDGNYKFGELFDRDVFKEISKYLKDDEYIFWDTLFSSKSTHNNLKKLFCNDYSPSDILMKETLYLNDDNYKKLQTKIDELEIKFIKCNIYDLVNILDSKYDIMYLSNILGRLGFVQAISDKSVLNHFIAFLNSLSKYLKENGEIIANYYYDYFRINSLYKYLEKNKFDLAHFKDIKIEKSGALIYR